jgi:hypothetical protein
MRYIQRIIISGFAMSMLVNAAGPLTGQWGGDHSNLVLDAKGGRIETDCGDGWIAGPITPTHKGSFVARGHFVINAGGPERMDGPDRRKAATFKGKLSGRSLALTIEAPGLSPPRKLNLVRDQQVKLFRCL